MPMNSTRFANRKILAIAWPMMLTSMSSPMLGLVDTALLGHLDSARYLAAVAIGANIIGLLFWGFGFLRMSTTSLVAQSLGREQHTPTNVTNKQKVHTAFVESDAVIFRAILMAAGLGLILALAAPLLINTIVSLMNASDNVSVLAADYIRIRLYAAPAALITYAISGWLIGTQRAKLALALVLTSNLVNIALDALFILVMDMNSNGAAAASVIAEYCSLLLGIAIIFKHTSIFHSAHWRAWLVKSRFKKAINMNYHLLVRTLLLLFAINFFTAQGALFGDSTLAANAILLQLALLSAYVMDGFSYAAEALCGESVGSRQAARFNQYARLCGLWIIGTAIIFMLLYFFAGNAIINGFSNVKNVTDSAQTHLYWLVMMPLAGAAAYLLDGVFIGAGKTQFMHYTMWLSLAVFIVFWWSTQSFANHGLWFAFIIFNLSRGLSLAACYPSILRSINRAA